MLHCAADENLSLVPEHAILLPNKEVKNQQDLIFWIKHIDVVAKFEYIISTLQLPPCFGIYNVNFSPTLGFAWKDELIPAQILQ